MKNFRSLCSRLSTSLVVLLLVTAIAPAWAQSGGASPPGRVPAVIDAAHALSGTISSIDPAAGRLMIVTVDGGIEKNLVVDNTTTISKRALPATLSDFSKGETLTVFTDDPPTTDPLRAKALMDARFAFFYLAKVTSSYVFPASVTGTDPARLTITVKKENGKAQTLALTPLSMIVLNNQVADLPDLRPGMEVVAEVEFLGFPEDEPETVMVRGIFDLSSFLNLKNSLVFGPLLGLGKVTAVDPALRTISIGELKVYYGDQTQWLSDISPGRAALLVGRPVRLFGFPTEDGSGYLANLVMTESVVPQLERNVRAIYQGMQPREENLVDGKIISYDPKNGILVVERIKGQTTSFERIHIIKGTLIVQGIETPADVLLAGPKDLKQLTVADLAPGREVIVRGIKGRRNIATFISIK